MVSNKYLAVMFIGFAGLLGLGVAAQLIKAFQLPNDATHDIGYKVGYSLPAVAMAAVCVWLLYKAYTLWNAKD